MLESLGRNWNCCWVGPLALDFGLLCKNKKQRESAGARLVAALMPKSVLPVEVNINCLGNEVLVRKSAYLSLMG